jgi:hypothetical protein
MSAGSQTVTGALDFIESNGIPAPVGTTRIQRKAGQLQQSTDGGDYTGLQANKIGDATVTDTYASVNDAIALQTAVTSAIARGDSGIHIPPGSHTFKSTVTVQAAQGIVIYGNERYATKIIIDDSSGNIGDGFLIKNTLACRIKDLTIQAQSPRTAGNAIHVVGGYSTETLDVGVFNLRDSGTLIEEVDMRDQFNGIFVESDDVNNYQNWRTYIRGGHHRNFSNGGCGIWFKAANDGATAKYGASHFISEYYFDATPPHTAGGVLAGIRLQGTGDITLTNNEVYGADYALLIDPLASAFLTCVNVIGGFYDTSNVNNLRIAPAASVNNFGVLKFIGPWFGTSFTGHSAHIVGARAKAMLFDGCSFQNSQTGWGAVVDQASNFEFLGCHFASNTSGGLFLQTASDFVVNGCKFVLQELTSALNVLPIGIHVVADCDHFTIAHNVVREPATKINNLAGVAANQRIVADNVLA